jgi:hypothetical protein
MIVSSVLDRSCFSLKENKFFLTGGHTALGLSLCAIRGYYYSIRPGMGQILLNRKMHARCLLEYALTIVTSECLHERILSTDPRQSVSPRPSNLSKRARAPGAATRLAGTGDVRFKRKRWSRHDCDQSPDQDHLRYWPDCSQAEVHAKCWRGATRCRNNGGITLVQE